MCYVTIHKPAVKFKVGQGIFIPGYRPDFEIRSDKSSVFGPGLENRPHL